MWVGVGLLVYVHRNYNEQGVQGREMYLELETERISALKLTNQPCVSYSSLNALSQVLFKLLYQHYQYGQWSAVLDVFNLFRQQAIVNTWPRLHKHLARLSLLRLVDIPTSRVVQGV